LIQRKNFTNFAKRDIGEIYLRNSHDILNVNVRNSLWGRNIKRIFTKTGLAWIKVKESFGSHYQDISTLLFV
jgi:hypothetical protein